MLTTYTTVTGTPIPRPGYLSPVREYAGYASQIERITDDPDGTIPVVGGRWAKRWSRHRYSKRAAWSHGGTYILIDQKSSTIPSPEEKPDPARLVLNGTTYAPLWSSRDGNARANKLKAASEAQWRPGYDEQMVIVRKGAAANTVEVEIIDTSTTDGATVGSVIVVSTAASGAYPATTQSNFGWLSEGRISDNGRWTALCSRISTPQHADYLAQHDYLVMVDLDNSVAGVRTDVSYATQAYPSSSYGKIDYATVSCDGAYVIVVLNGEAHEDRNKDSADPYASGDMYAFVLTRPVNIETTPCAIKVLDEQALRMGPANALDTGHPDAGHLKGLLPWLSHLDINVDSAGNQVVVGGVRGLATDKYGRNSSSGDPRAANLYGDVIMVRLDSGNHKHVSPGDVQLGSAGRAASQNHTSGCTGRRGWALISTDRSSGTVWAPQEIQWVRLLATNTPTGTREIERWCKLRTDDKKVSGSFDGYSGEAHPTPNTDGTKVMFASNWYGADANPQGPSKAQVRSYVVSNTLTVPAYEESVAASGAYEIRAEASDFTVYDTRTGEPVDSDALLETLNGAPSRVQFEADEAPGAL